VTTNVVNIKDFVPPRPKGIPDHISAEVLVEAVRGWLMGDEPRTTAEALDINTQTLIALQRSPDWRTLMNFCRDEFQLTVGARMVRIENKLLDKIEDYVDHGCTLTFVDEKGRLHETSREITPKEAVSIALMMNEVNKRVDKVRNQDATRKTFDPVGLIAKLERMARVAEEKEVTGSATREPD